MNVDADSYRQCDTENATYIFSSWLQKNKNNKQRTIIL